MITSPTSRILPVPDQRFGVTLVRDKFRRCGNVRQIGATHSSAFKMRHSGATHKGGGCGTVGGTGVEDGFNVVWVKGADQLLSGLSEGWLKEERLERIWVLMNLILERTARGDTKDGYCPISTRLLEQQIGRDFAGPALQELVEIGILECDNKYIPNKKARGYRFAPNIAKLEAKRYLLSEAQSSRLLKWSTQKSLMSVKGNDSHRILWNNLQKLTLHPFCNEQLPSVGANGEGQLKRDAWQYSTDSIIRRRWYFSHDPKSGRVFNNFTSLPKSIRHYALLDGKPCAEIDIRNSQPFFLARLYPDKCTEARSFGKLVCEGRFYESLNEASSRPFDPENRRDLKQAVFTQVLFGQRFPTNPLWVAFQKEWPVLSQVVEKLTARDYRKLAIELQRQEASVMIGQVVHRIAAAFPGIPFLTVHDSLVVPHQITDAAKELLQQTIQEVTGNSPSLSVKLPPSELIDAK